MGTVAFCLHEAGLGLRLGPDILTQTGDLDPARLKCPSIALGDAVPCPVAEVLSELCLDFVPSLDCPRVWT